MAETHEQYMIQWKVHGQTITERFGRLLERQALVDVTLSCQGQQMRVHKLVLASCSPFFEEMLEPHLCHEPIILFENIDFLILKAIIEFMYYGQTSILHCHLQSLLIAAQQFRVKDLDIIVNSIIDSNPSIDNDVQDILEVGDSEQTTGSMIDEGCVQVNLSKKDIEEKNNTVVEDSFDNSDLSYKVGECSRVYPNKKRKSVNGKNSPLKKPCKIMPQKLTKNGIDLFYDSKCDITPFTLTSMLEMQSADFGFNDIERSTYGDPFKVSICDISPAMKKPPVLRRSVRIKQLQNHLSEPIKLDTIPYVNLSVSGDITDGLENRENGESHCGDYPKNKEIPFAIGILPMTAALRRVQAMPDHRRRKTRSSVAPPKQNPSSLKRKANVNKSDPGPAIKKQNISKKKH